MSMLGCSCGKTIYDNTDHLSYKGHAIADTEWFELFDRISTDVAGYIRSRVAGTERQWLTEYFRGDATMDDRDLAHTIITRHFVHARISIYQCPTGSDHPVRARSPNRIERALWTNRN